ncbi:hypothetical protein CEXT_657871 [Caerostris extrusa]|uniref:Uncharacterized protein n=1 Tax=Caerostris extrusa TaxID=172846 RepID=A0AAV4WVM7_CAEEX|nr:hypothetical protein CEXT_657871 [Caerostris extrusa]
MLCKRKLTTTTLRQLRSIPSPTHQKKINLIVFCCVACHLLSISLTHATDKEYKDDFVIKSILMGMKMFCYSLEHPTFTNMVGFFYCTACFVNVAIRL